MQVLLGEAPLDSATEHNVGLVGQLICIVCEEKGNYPEASEVAVKSVGSFLEFLVRCHNTRPSPAILQVECSVISVLYEMAGILEGGLVLQEQISPYVPFLLHASYVQLKTFRKTGVEVFGMPPKRLHNGHSLCEGDNYVWLSTSLLRFVSPSYFTQLLGYRKNKDDLDLQMTFIYELQDQSLFLLKRSMETLYAIPLNIKSPDKRGCAEPKVIPKRVLSFLLDEDDSGVTPPSDYTTEDHDDCGHWEYSRETVESHAGLLLHRIDALSDVVYPLPVPAPLPQQLGGNEGVRPLKLIVPLQVKLICGALYWVLVSLLGAITNLLPISDESSLVALWRNSAVHLVKTITLFCRYHSLLEADEAQMITIQLFKGCLHVIAIDQAFAAYHPQGSFDTTPLPLPKGTIPKDVSADSRPCAHPLLHLLSRCHARTLYAAFAGSKEEKLGGASRPPLELSIATCLHSIFMTHLGVSQNSNHNREAAAVPIQNLFRGLHVVLSEVVVTPAWKEIFTSSGTQSGKVILGPNWLKATEISKGFAVLPFGRDVPAEQVQLVSQNAWTLVHYYFQLSIPCAPTAPPSQISILRPGKGWDDYEEYFQDIERRVPAASFKQDFGLNDVPGEQGYRLQQLLSSHLRGILTVIPYFRILFVINKRFCNKDKCAYYCSSMADLLMFSAHNHGVAVPFLRTYVFYFLQLFAKFLRLIKHEASLRFFFIVESICMDVQST